MKRFPFNLKAALKGAKVVTAQGYPVTDLTLKGFSKWPVKGTLHYPSGGTSLLSWSEEGHWLSGPHVSENLFMAFGPRKITYWVNFYPESGMMGDCAYGFKTREQADHAAHESRIGKARKVALEVAE